MSASEPGTRDPVTSEGLAHEGRRARSRRGAPSGVEANLLVVPRHVPHLGTRGEDLAATLSGDLSREARVRGAAEPGEAR